MEISKLKDENMDNFFEAVLTMKSIDDCYKFFEDICTVNELKSISQRFAVAKMLNDKCVYTDIVAKTGASTATISRVNRTLNYGADGYKLVFERLSDK
ncbi:MAG TPA: TrpR-like protein, YerC/YecD [Firmicutes bacterium]|nr:TrpR-like protein, YerC/YecD [Bacillota bacterium]